MKLEALQSLSVAVMIAGLFLSALGGFGAYFFSGGSERSGRLPASAHVESAEPELPRREFSDDAKLASLIEPVPEVTAKQISLLPEPALPPVAEKLPEPAPAPVIAAAPTPAPRPQPAKPEPALVTAKTTGAETKPVPAPPPVAEKIPAPAPIAATKPAKTETAPLVIAKATVAETKAPAAPAATLGIEPWQKDKLLQRLRAFQNGTIAIQVPQGNGEAMNFATALKEAFVTAGWQVASLTEVKTDREQTGLTLSSGTFPPPTEVTTVFSALVSAGMKLSTDLDPSQGKKHAILFVGSRP